MLIEENKAIVHRLLQEVVNQRNLTLIDDIVANNCVFHGSGGQEVRGTSIMKQMLTTFFNAFDNFRVNIEDIIGEGDKVVVRFIEIGRHQGEFEGIAPTGKEMTWTEIAIFRIVNGRIIEWWTLEDKLSLMKQMGAISLSK